MKKKPDYSSFFYFNPLPSWVYDLKTFKILDVNQAAISHYGYTKEEFLNLNITDLRPKDEIPKLVELLHSEIEKQDGNIYLGVFNHKKKNGDLIRMEINVHKVDYLVIESMMVVGNDVTEEEAQLKDLKLSEERLHAATSIAKLGYWRLEMDANTLSWTDEIFNIWGRERHSFELNYENFFTNIHPEDRELFTQEQNASFAGEKELNIVHRIILPDNSIRWVHELGRLVKDENGKPVAFEGTVQDITGRKEEEQRLKLLESVITNTNDAIIITEAEPVEKPGPRIIYVNEAFTKMTGYTSEEVIGKTPRILQGPKSDKAELARLKKALINWESCEITTINYKKNGDEFWINLSVSPVANEKGWYTHFISIERDVTEQKNKEREIELLGKISLNFSIDNNLHTSAYELCKTISEFGQFDFTELWLPNIENTQIQLFTHKTNSLCAETFYEWSKDAKYFHTGEGLPGVVWLKKSIILWDDIGKNDEFIRKEAAEKAGIETVMGIPLFFNKNCVGVLVIGTQQGINYLTKYVTVFEQLEQFIGSEISRKKLENDLNHLYEAIPDVLCLADFEGRILKMNKAGCELLGYTEEEMLYHSFDEFVHPEDKDISGKEVKNLSEGQTTFRFENRYLTKAGAIVWLSWTCHSAVQEGLIYATAKNITEEKKLRELNRQANMMAKIGSWEIDLTAGKLFWGEMVHILHETDPASFTPDLATAINFYREDFRPLVQTYIEKSIATGVAFDFEAILITSKKNERWVRAIGNAELVDGQCKRIYGSFQDIHDRKEAELRLQSLANNLPGVVFQYLIYPDGTDAFKYVNKGAEQVWGYSPEAVLDNIQLVWNQTQAGGDYKKVRQSIMDAARTKSKWTARYKSVLPNGEVRTHLGTGTPDFLTDGTILFNSVVLDITQEAKTEELLELASNMARIGSWELDLINQQDDTMYWSPMTRQILEVGEFYNPSLTTSLEYYTEESKQHMQNAIDLLIQEGKEFDEELMLITASGKEKWVRSIGKSTRINNTCIKIYGSFQDIQASKSLEIQIREILESISDYFYALDGELNFTYMNSSCANLLAVKKEKIIGKKLFTEFPDLKNTQFEDELRKVQNTAEAAKFEFYYAPFDVWFEESIYPTPTGISVYFADINQRKKANAEIAKSEEKRRLIMNGALDAIISIDTNEAITFWNAQAEVIFGWKAEEVMGKPLSEMIIPEPFRKYHIEGLKNYLKTGEGKALNALLELSAIRRNGEEFPIELTVIPIKQGGEEFFCAFIRDITQRKNSESKLIENENYLRTILDNEPECVKILNSNGELLSMNPAGLAMIEADNEQQVLGQRMTDLVNKEYHFGFNRLSKEVFKGNSGSFEFEITGLKGGCRWLQTHAVPLKDTTGKIVNLLGVTRDITEQKKAEEKLLNAFNEKTRILERITEAFVSLDNNWCYTYMNKQAGEIFNRDPEKIIGKHIWTEFPEGLNQPFHLAYEKAMATQEYIYLEEHYKPYDLWFENHIYPSPDGISIFFRDVTERKRSEEKLKMANERFEKATEATSDVIWDWNLENHTFFRSKGIEKFFGGQTLKTFEEENFWKDAFHPEYLPQIMESINMAIEDPQCSRWEMEYIVFNEQRENVYVMDRGLILRDKDGKAIRMIGAMTDITERKNYENQLLRLNESIQQHAHQLELTNEELEQFAYIASHDLQEPLRMISSFLDQLRRKYGDRLDEKGHQYIHFATDGAKRMKQIILDLLDYSRAGKSSDSKEEVDMNEVVEEYKLLRRKMIAEKNAVLFINKLPVVKSYKAPVVQTLHSLLDNAIKYSREGQPPQVTIAAEELTDVWKITITDNGIGIDAKFFEKIFIIFQRLHNRDEYIGSGIGLSIAKKQVESWGGKIGLDSTPGKGSVFYFTHPKEINH